MRRMVVPSPVPLPVAVHMNRFGDISRCATPWDLREVETRRLPGPFTGRAADSIALVRCAVCAVAIRRPSVVPFNEP